MSRQICLPINQVRLTNVAVVRMNRGGKRFEIACYRNKVVNYRQGLETDLSEVLQTDRVFTNVSKGQFANQHDLEEVFGTRDEHVICQTILDKGTLQVSDLERSQQLENTAREIATTVANTCVHPTSQRPYTVPQIREAMRSAEFAVHPTRTVKRQYLDCVKLLQAKNILPLERAKMKLLLIYPMEQTASVDSALTTLHIVPAERSSTENESHVVVLVDPSLYRDLDAIAKNVNGRLEILVQVVRQEGDVNLEEEMERKERKMEANEALSNKMEHSLRIDEQGNDDGGVDNRRTQDHPNNAYTGNDDDDVDVDDDVAMHHSSNSRQYEKKTPKKSKKNKRREKEEAMERQARMEAEQQRQRHEEKRTASQAVAPSSSAGIDDTAAPKNNSCNTCGGSFPTSTLYRAHFRSDWHRYNIKLKMKGIAPVSEQEFVLCDSNVFFEDM